ncbi:MAG TPA: formate--tetrahydrofolate ligase [Terriglobia bacterium]|nr:formate--tetrahydrofolate ligase [Terriglobia bacterium]
MNRELVKMLPIREIADQLEIPEDYLEYYGKHTAKLKLELLSNLKSRPAGKLILVTAMTPTSQGEGKTVLSIGLAQAIQQLGKRSMVTLREPSLGPVFGVKGGATGGGKSRVIPGDLINLHFNGDFHAVTSAHNLLAAMIDSHLHHGNALQIDVDNIFWPRAIDMNDRALRHAIVGLGGKANGVPRETGWVITAASEVMAILALANSRQDLRRRLNEIVIGLDLKGKVLRASDLKATGAMMVLLNEAILPNLVQTCENTPALVHTGPFANIAHGTSSVLSQKMALKLADYTVNETGFGADLGAEKYMDIVMTSSGLKPAAAVLIATVKGLAAQGGLSGEAVPPGQIRSRYGFSNLAKHVENLRKFNLPLIVALNRFPSDTAEELDAVQHFCREVDAECAITEVFEKGGAGALELAAKAMALADRSYNREIVPLYPATLSIEQKIERVAREIYGAHSVHLESAARKRLQRINDLGFGRLPICIAKTQSSLSDNPKLLGAPRDWMLTVTDAHLAAGAGFIVLVAGNMLLMPGLSKNPQAMALDVDDGGHITGLA